MFRLLPGPVSMDSSNETEATIKSRLNILIKGLISEENSVQYYQSLLDKASDATEEQIGARRMYQDLMDEESKHVDRFRQLIEYWENQLKELM